MSRKLSVEETDGGDSKSMTISQLCTLLQKLVKVPQVTDVWVVGELSDFTLRGGHCYADLVEKDDDGKPVAKIPLRIWNYMFNAINAKFERGTGQPIATGLKVKVCVAPSIHKLYGLSVIANDIDPAYTMGDLLRRRKEIIDRLTREGIIDLNRQLAWPDVPVRLAVISSPFAAGYGDFLNQLYNNEAHIRFTVKLFEAMMQGERACPTIIAALDRIAAEADQWDGVVIIRGGGASLDLQCFENYDLAATVAQFPLPVMIGIGHERDITVLDYVANRRVKTPTAAAEWFIKRGESLLNRLNSIGSALLQRATDMMAAEKEQLSYFEGVISVFPINAVRHADQKLFNSAGLLSNITARRIIPAAEKINSIESQLAVAARGVIMANSDRLTSAERLLNALSPQSVLARGYSVTRAAGRIMTSAADVAPGTEITTQLASGEIVSIVK
ncbi:MAG: exodeoxyribonuclease VII large subunit [Bacteroidales bacterium]|nr:exodeoxyribonuclease VII large subunit [Bacteroidales bacterium]MBD5235639.1 exodeoxyribonuclease VII large subunit [Barnesiella sp.]MBD5258717.1 exodeoxyribonuclease VII large subunit [Barnesiella sp.]